MGTYQISHTHEDGTLIEGTERGDAAIGILKANGWRWSRNLGSWYVPRSRDSFAPRAKIDATVRALEAAGHTVTLDIDDEPRSTAQVEADRAVRAQERTEALREKAVRAEERSRAAWDRAEATGRALPPGGEPIKVGHHSEGRHRRALERAHSAMGAAVAANREAEEAARRAESASHTTGARYAPITVANRIDKLEADRRRLARQKVTASGEWAEKLAALLARTEDQLDYWRGVHEAQIAAGEAADLGPDSVHVGDLVQIKGRYWERVVRVNKKTVTVRDTDGWENRVPYSRLTARRAPAAA